jgi:LPXTG-motif cell wall-anchored protein
MFEKLKKFYKKHEVVVLTIGGTIVIVTAGVLFGKKNKK